MKGKIIMIENRKISDDEQVQTINKLKKDARKVVVVSNDYPGGHIKSLRFKGGLQIRN